MNAHELADKLENEINLSENLFVFDAADMLRQQADRIAELEKDLYMIQRHYDQLETFSPSGNNAHGARNAEENLQNGKA